MLGFHGLFFSALLFGFGLSPFTPKDRGARAAGGSSLQRAPPVWAPWWRRALKGEGVKAVQQRAKNDLKEQSQNYGEGTTKDTKHTKATGGARRDTDGDPKRIDDW